MALVLRRTDHGVVADMPFVITCGCGSVVPDVRALMRAADINNVPLLSSTSNDTAKAYLRQVGLVIHEPSLLKGRHAVLYNPHTAQWINLLDLKATPAILSNIRKVAQGIS